MSESEKFFKIINDFLSKLDEIIVGLAIFIIVSFMIGFIVMKIVDRIRNKR
jgi:hypothetical protein